MAHLSRLTNLQWLVFGDTSVRDADLVHLKPLTQLTQLSFDKSQISGVGLENLKGMTCSYADWDGAYVLGSLAPGERLDFERHMGDCKACALAVRQIAGLPGLLARVDAGVLDDHDPGRGLPPVPTPSCRGCAGRSVRAPGAA